MAETIVTQTLTREDALVRGRELVQEIRALLKKTKPKRKDLGGPGSGNFGHVGRPGEVGGSGEGSGDRAGMFITKDSSDVGGEIEGAGPERAEYLTRHAALKDAIATEAAAKKAVEDTAESLKAQYQGVGGETMWGQLVEDPAYEKARKEQTKAAVLLIKAEDALAEQEPAMRVEVISNVSRGIAKELGVSPAHIEVVHAPPRTFRVGNSTFKEAAIFDRMTGKITLNAQMIDHADTATVKGVAAHELAHLINNRFEDDVKTWGDNPAITPEMIKENGHSAYAKSYWTPDAVGTDIGNDYSSAIKETIAEVARYLVSPKSWVEDGHPEPKSQWVSLVKDLMARQKADKEYAAVPESKAVEEFNRKRHEKWQREEDARLARRAERRQAEQGQGQ